jgi:hypothetical protein
MHIQSGNGANKVEQCLRVWGIENEHLQNVTFVSSAFGCYFCYFNCGSPPPNYTFNVPEGTLNHNDPHLLCTPTGWQDIITFYLGIYLAHVATIISLPGESTKATIRVSLASLLFPISGLMRGSSTILTFASFAKTDLQKAARSRALCVVVRTQDWKPEPWDSIADAYLEETPTAAEGTISGIIIHITDIFSCGSHIQGFPITLRMCVCLTLLGPYYEL